MLAKIFNTTSKSKHSVLSAAVQEQKRELGYINSYTILELFHNDHLVNPHHSPAWVTIVKIILYVVKELHVTHPAESVFLFEMFEVWDVQISPTPEITQDVIFFFNHLS